MYEVLSFFFQKTGFDNSCKSAGDNLSEMPNLVSGKSKTNVPVCCLLKNLMKS